MLPSKFSPLISMKISLLYLNYSLSNHYYPTQNNFCYVVGTFVRRRQRLRVWRALNTIFKENV